MRRALELAQHARRAPRPEPAGRLRPAGRRTARRSRGLPPRRRDARTPRSAALAEAGAAPRGVRRPSSRSSRATTPVAPVPCAAGADRRRRRARRVRAARPEPGRRGGEARLRAAGVDVDFGLLEREARALNRAWTFGARARSARSSPGSWPTTLDGRSAALTARAAGSPASRPVATSTALRAQCDAILVGTGTVERDDPQLTVRDEIGEPVARERQPLRVVMGHRELPATRRVFDDVAETVQLRTHDPGRCSTSCTREAASTCSSRAARPSPPPSCAPGWSTRWSPTSPRSCSGGGLNAVADLDVTSIGGRRRSPRCSTSPGSGDDVRLTLQPRRA